MIVSFLPGTYETWDLRLKTLDIKPLKLIKFNRATATDDFLTNSYTTSRKCQTEFQEKAENPQSRQNTGAINIR